MRFDPFMTDQALLQWIGARLAEQRLARNLTQQQVAEQAGLGVRTVQRLEQGDAAVHLSGFLRVSRVLGLLDNLETFLPPIPVSPVLLAKLAGRKRRRATGKKAAASAPKAWTWGEQP